MITKEQYIEAKKIVKDYESQKAAEKLIVNSKICRQNRDPKECSVSLYTSTSCAGCYYFIKTKEK